MLSATELAAQLKSSEEFIEHDAMDLFVTRRTKIDNGSGGFKLGPPETKGPFRVRLIPQSRTVPEVSTLDGKLLRPRYVVMGMPGTDIQRGDIFMHNGDCEIAGVHGSPEYAFKADVVLRG